MNFIFCLINLTESEMFFFLFLCCFEATLQLTTDHSKYLFPSTTAVVADAVWLLQHVTPLTSELIVFSRGRRCIRISQVSTFLLCTCNSFSLSPRVLRYRDLAVLTLGDKKKLSAEDRCRCVLQQSKLQGWQVCLCF